MELTRIEPNLFTLNILINCFCYFGQMDLAFSLLGEILKLRLSPNYHNLEYTYENGLCKTKRVDDALNLFEEMHPDTVTYSSLIENQGESLMFGILLMRCMIEVNLRM